MLHTNVTLHRINNKINSQYNLLYSFSHIILTIYEFLNKIQISVHIPKSAI